MPGAITRFCDAQRGWQDVAKKGGDKSKQAEARSLINTLTCKFDAVRRVAARFGMKESMDNWDIYWTDTSITVDRCKEMKRYQRINHFPGMFEICRKDQLARNLNRLQKLHPEEFIFFPKTWCLRSEISEVLEYAKSHKNDVYIIKPNIGCQGKGICITNNVNRLKRCDDMICQVYLQKPLLIDGYKFDLRVYVLITSCDPLRVFVYNEGLARFATAKYRRPDSLNAGNQFMHLTNYSVNKHSQAYVVGDDGTKRRLSSINQWFVNNNHDLKKIWRDIDDAIVKTVMASLPTVRHEYHVAFPHHGTSYACFEILGFDFIFDCQIRPYILEVNHAPSLQTDTDIDHEVKDALLEDAFKILNLPTTNRVDILAEDRRRAWERLFSVTRQGSVLSRERARNELIARQKVEWENAHLGNFRKIYPSRKISHYERFLTAQSTLFAGTCSSRAKETGSPKYKTNRYKLFKMQKIPLSSKPSGNSFTLKVGKRPAPKKSLKTLKSTRAVTNKIDDSEERVRLAALRKRDSLVKSYGMFEKVFENFKNAGLLRKSDEIRMQEMGLDLRADVRKSCEEPKFANINPHDALETITKTMEPAADRMNSINSVRDAACDFTAHCRPTVIDEHEESERTSLMEKRASLLESIGIHKVVHDYFRQSGLLKIEERVKSKAIRSPRRNGELSKKTRGKNVENKRLKRVRSAFSVVSTSKLSGVKSAGRSWDDRRSWSKKQDSERSKKIHRVVAQLETLIKLWKEKHKRGADLHGSAATGVLKDEDSPDVWATPPEECPALKIQPEFRLNPEVP